MRDVDPHVDALRGSASAEREPPAALRREVHVAAALAGIAIVAAAALAAIRIDAGHAARWGLAAGIVAGGQLWLLRSRLHTNRRPGTRELLPTLGVGTALTLARGLLVAGLAGLLVVPQTDAIPRWTPGGVYLLAVGLDGLDGVVARRRGTATRLGAALDGEIDGLGLLVGAILGVMLGRLPAWYLATGFARYAYVGALAFRRARGRRVGSLPPSRARRMLAVAQMLVVGVALLPVLDAGPLGYVAAAVGLPFLAGFARDWLLATGRLGGRTP